MKKFKGLKFEKVNTATKWYKKEYHWQITSGGTNAETGLVLFAGGLVITAVAGAVYTTTKAAEEVTGATATTLEKIADWAEEAAAKREAKKAEKEAKKKAPKAEASEDTTK